jgi:hypothetical protein
MSDDPTGFTTTPTTLLAGMVLTSGGAHVPSRIEGASSSGHSFFNFGWIKCQSTLFVARLHFYSAFFSCVCLC